jgi:hypothetical protein
MILQARLRSAERTANGVKRIASRRTFLEEPKPDEGLVEMLRSINQHDDAAEQLDSASLSRCLGWTSLKTAASIDDAKGRLLIWAIRVGGSSFEDIELTVQGRRLLRSAAEMRPAT